MRILDQQFESLGCDLKIKTLRHMRGIGRACVEDSFLLLPKLLQTSLLAAERMVKSQSAELGAAGSLRVGMTSPRHHTPQDFSPALFLDREKSTPCLRAI